MANILPKAHSNCMKALYIFVIFCLSVNFAPLLQQWIIEYEYFLVGGYEYCLSVVGHECFIDSWHVNDFVIEWISFIDYESFFGCAHVLNDHFH